MQFKSLEDLAHFINVTKPKGFTIDTTTLTLKTTLSELETAIAVEQYAARVLPQTNLQTRSTRNLLYYTLRMGST